MVRGLPSSEWSIRAWLKCSSWSTASLPTRASPTNSTRSGEFTLISCTERREGGREGGGRREGGRGKEGGRGGEGGEGGSYTVHWSCML